MGKASMVNEKANRNKKKRGRPSLFDLHNRPHNSPIPILINPNSQSQSQSQSPNPNLRSSSDSDHDAPLLNKDEKGWKGTDTHKYNGTTRTLDTGPTDSTTTPLPGNKKLLLLILDKLQKKDTRAVFAEPVDPEELPDYHEVIKNPMDFRTVKKKLGGGVYLTLEQLEADIHLICSNAMEYNAPSTIYFRQARSIQELAKQEFDVLRQESGNIEPPPKPRRGRPPGSRTMKKLPESFALDCIARESSSDATPASRDEDTMKSNSYNLRKGPSLYRFPRNIETSFDFTGSKSMPMKYIERQYDSEESKRETYNPFGRCGSGQDPSLQSIFGSFDRNLISVGLEFEHTYARSLAQFASGLGPVARRIVSNKLRSIPNKMTSDFAYSHSSVEHKNDWSSSPIVHHPGVNGSSFHFQERMPVQNTLPLQFKSHSFEPEDGSRSLSSSRVNENMGVHGVPYWKNVPVRRDVPCQEEQTGLANGSPTPLDLGLQL